jgi:hypothetical protein
LIDNIVQHRVHLPERTLICSAGSECGVPAHDLFRSYDDLGEQAYDLQGERIAYSAGSPEPSDEAG